MDYGQAKRMDAEIWGNFSLKQKEIEDAQKKKLDTGDLEHIRK